MKTDLLFSSFPFISSKKITLSKIQLTDCDALAKLLCNEYSTTEFLRLTDSAFSSRAHIELGIFKSDNQNDLLGTIKISSFDYEVKSAKIDFHILEECDENGIAECAIMALLKYMFEIIEINRLYATTTVSDAKWICALKRCGFTCEGNMKESVFANNIICDLSVYGLLKKDYPLIARASLIERNGELSIVKMTGEDYAQMSKWLTDEKVLKYYDGRDNPSDLQQVVDTFQAKVNGLDTAVPCIIRENGRSIGYIQFYPVLEEITELKLTEYKTPYGIDLFIGESDCRGRGLGAKIIRMICNYLFKTNSNIKADVVIGNPQAWNQRSINAFAKAGFTKETILADHELHEGRMEANVIMHRSAE